MIEITRKKTGQTQTIYLIEPLRAVLRRLQFTNKPRVFLNAKKEPISKGQFDHAFRDALAGAEIEDFRWHDFRRMVGTRLAASNIPLYAQQKALGHAPDDVHGRHYVALSRADLIKVFESALTNLEQADQASATMRNIEGEPDTLSRVVEG